MAKNGRLPGSLGPGSWFNLTDSTEVGEDPEALALAEVVGAEPSTVYPCRHPEHPKEAVERRRPVDVVGWSRDVVGPS